MCYCLTFEKRPVHRQPGQHLLALHLLRVHKTALPSLFDSWSAADVLTAPLSARVPRSAHPHVYCQREVSFNGALCLKPPGINCAENGGEQSTSALINHTSICIPSPLWQVYVIWVHNYPTDNTEKVNHGKVFERLSSLKFFLSPFFFLNYSSSVEC